MERDCNLNSPDQSEILQLPAGNLTNERRKSKRKLHINAVTQDRKKSLTEKKMVDKSVPRKVKIISTRSSEKKCSHCNKNFADDVTLRLHIKSCHTPFHCKTCGKINVGFCKARYHKIIEHTEPKHKCAKCSKEFHFKVPYHRHFKACKADRPKIFLGRTKHFINEDFLSNYKNINKLNIRCKNEQVSSNECSHCGIKETNSVNLVRHILTHHEPVACNYCGITSPSFTLAMNHKETAHKETSNKCPYCSMQSARTKQFNRHVRKCQNLKFPCDFCGKMFAKLQAVIDHKRYCHVYYTLDEKHKSLQIDESDLKCYYCFEDFPTPGYLKHHLKKHHELTKCEICGITILGMSTPKNHKILCHTNPKFVCPTCGKKFYDKVRYNSHWPPCGRKKYSCEICGERFKQLSSVHYHRKQEHPDGITDKETMASSQNDSGQSWEGNSSDLKEINLQSTSENEDESYEDRKESKLLAVASSNDSEENVVSENMLKPLVENSPVQQYKCSICGLTFPEFSIIKEHMLQSHTDGQFNCQFCSKKFRNKNTADAHEEICSDRQFSCEFCSKKFKFLRGLKNHKEQSLECKGPSSNEVDQKSNSAQKKDFETSSEEDSPLHHKGAKSSSSSSSSKCTYCEKSFSTKALLTRHIELHHDPCACEICGLTFTTVVKASYHKITDHWKQTKLQCPYCPLKFVIVERYKQHLSICKTKGFTCDDCGKKFTAQRYYITHKKKHKQGEKTSKNSNCPVCGQDFDNQLLVSQHLEATHQIIMCNVCRKTFASTDELMEHQRSCVQQQLQQQQNDGRQLNSHDPQKAQNPSLDLPHDTIVDLEMEIKVEETELQEQEYQVPNENAEQSSTADQHTIFQNAYESEPNSLGEYEIEIKEECLEDGYGENFT